MSMAEKALDGAEGRENRLTEAHASAMEAGTHDARLGVWIAIFLAVACVVASIVFFATGNAVAGTALISLPVVLLIRSFLKKEGGTPSPES